MPVGCVGLAGAVGDTSAAESVVVQLGNLGHGNSDQP
jgi:hypothetical protein